MRTVAGGRPRRLDPRVWSGAVPADPWGEITATPGRCVYTDRTERPWRIYDLTEARPGARRLAAGDPAASIRVFVSPAGRKVVYRFRRGERHDLRPAHLALQLEEAERASAQTPLPPARRGDAAAR